MEWEWEWEWSWRCRFGRWSMLCCSFVFFFFLIFWVRFAIFVLVFIVSCCCFDFATFVWCALFLVLFWLCYFYLIVFFVLCYVKCATLDFIVPCVILTLLLEHSFRGGGTVVWSRRRHLDSVFFSFFPFFVVHCYSIFCSLLMARIITVGKTGIFIDIPFLSVSFFYCISDHSSWEAIDVRVVYGSVKSRAQRREIFFCYTLSIMLLLFRRYCGIMNKKRLFTVDWGTRHAFSTHFQLEKNSCWF